MRCLCQRSARQAPSITSRRMRSLHEKYGAIVVATGFDAIKLDKYDEYAYSQSKDVITSLELERIMNAAGPPQRVIWSAFPMERRRRTWCSSSVLEAAALTSSGKSYCSKICCMYTAKHAMLIRDKYPDVKRNRILH